LIKYYKMLNALGLLLMVVSIFLIVPVFCALIFSEFEIIWGFVVPAFFFFGLGILIFYLTRKHKKVELAKRYATVLVFLSWIAAFLVGAMPFLLIGNLNFTQALFESISGLTTTGFTVVNVELTYKSILLWRSIMQFVGGLGVIFVIQILIHDRQATMLYTIEGHSERILPNINKTLKLIGLIYCSYMVVGIILYIIGGMSVFDAVNHSMTAISTGGFSTRAQSIGYYNSLYIECVTIFLMLLGSINFAIHILMFSGRFKKIYKIFELKVTGIIILLTLPLMVFVGFSGVYSTVGEQVRVGVFQTVSVFTTTGFSISNASMTEFAVLGFAVLMLIGGQMGSTSGGIKQYRIGLCFKTFYWNIKVRIIGENKVYQPHIVNPVGKVYITKADIEKNKFIILLFFFFWLFGCFILTAFSYPLILGMFEFASAIGNVGLNSKISAASGSGLLWFLMIAMILGRLEFITVFVAIFSVLGDCVKKLKNAGKRANLKSNV